MRIKTEGLAGHYAPLFGGIFKLLDVDVGDTQRAFLFIFARGVTSAAVRLGLIGAYEAQAMQADLSSHIDTIVQTCGSLAPARHRADRAADRSVPVDSRPSVFEVISIMSAPRFHHAEHPHTHDGDPTTPGSFSQRAAPNRRDYGARSFTSASAGRSAAARPRCCCRSAASCAIAISWGSSRTTSSRRRTPSF